ncbi:MAG: peptidylprolyl isomerase [Novosphingobium sp.]|nr:peptidylprolyl isomerase [Novosphingobium sp.]
MDRKFLLALLAACAALPAPAQTPQTAPSPGEIAAAAPAVDWVDIAADDLLVMTLAPDAKGEPRRVIMQLMPPPFSQGWIANIRTLAAAHWYDGNAIYRVQDNYVTQWGDPNADDEKKAKTLPPGLRKMPERDYTIPMRTLLLEEGPISPSQDRYSRINEFSGGWPYASDVAREWPIHCYGAVGVSRGQRPDTGDGTSLYAVNGHAPRHLDRNIAVVGRVVEGMEHLSALPRGTATLGFYKDEADYVPILSVRLASELPAGEQPHLQYLSTESASFAKYANARANRRDPFFLVPAGGADICNIPVPIRRKP